MPETTYRCVIADAGFTDYTLPIASFQMRLRQSPKQCYLSVVIPSVLNHAQAIADRIDGTITLSQIVGGSETELLDANIYAFRQYLGANKRSGQITAYKQITFSSPASISIPELYYKSVDDTVTRYRLPATVISPGDDLTIGGDTYEPTEIQWGVSTTQSVVEMTNG